MTRVLIVEDALLTRRVISKALQSEGYELVEATNGRQGLEMVASHQPDCIVLDLLMPDLDGWGVLQALRHQGCTIPAIVITADMQDSSRQRCLDLGAVAVLHKLPDPDNLRRVIKTAIAPPVESRL